MRNYKYGLKNAFREGEVINYVRVIGLHLVQGRYGPLSRGMYDCECIAPTGQDGAECGKKLVLQYRTLYYRSRYSCGCLKRIKHPPVMLEGDKFGRLEVLRWTEEKGGTWECVCHECARLIYIRTVKIIRAHAESCEGHEELTIKRDDD